ncbi:hypothetical protein SCHPADRAFT_515963 [Schizopora paradoxa]|uniref:Uncharacterized protein n=1 Tax=Schizopora paradoxa TaxID=27342 RepID=A0A0H2RM37_9AGAM|nr:hypothetical protein SCHPADRAFT_515963 [Schizopora paradoxa]
MTNELFHLLSRASVLDVSTTKSSKYGCRIRVSLLPSRCTIHGLRYPRGRKRQLDETERGNLGIASSKQLIYLVWRRENTVGAFQRLSRFRNSRVRLRISPLVVPSSRSEVGEHSTLSASGDAHDVFSSIRRRALFLLHQHCPRSKNPRVHHTLHLTLGSKLWCFLRKLPMVSSVGF